MELLSTLSALLFCGDESTACAATIDGGANVCCVHRMVGCGREEEEVGWEAVAEVEKFSLLGKCALSRTCTNYMEMVSAFSCIHLLQRPAKSKDILGLAGIFNSRKSKSKVTVKAKPKVRC